MVTKCANCGTYVPKHEDSGPYIIAIEVVFGYGSYHDMEKHTIYLCESCYDELLLPLATVEETGCW